MPARINDGIAENEFCDVHGHGNESPKWTWIDYTMRHVIPAGLGGGPAYQARFKTAFVIHNRATIIAAAHTNNLPAELLAGVAWVESAGKSNSLKGMTYAYRLMWRDEYGYPTKKPADKTSFGFLSMQLRAAAETLGIDPDILNEDLSKQRQLAACLERDTYLINLAAKHLRMLAEHDNLGNIGEDEVRVLAARYNYGTSRTLLISSEPIFLTAISF